MGGGDGVCVPSGFIHERLQQRPEITDAPSVLWRSEAQMKAEWTPDGTLGAR